MSQNQDGWSAPPPDYTNLIGRPAVLTAPDIAEISQPLNAPILIIVPPILGKSSEQITCRNCKAVIHTRTKRATGMLTWLIVGLVCFIGGSCGCCLIPFCVDSCKDVEHFCPNCRALQGRYSYI